MEEPFNQTSTYSRNNTNTTSLTELTEMFLNIHLITDSLVFFVAFPVICITLYGLYSLVKSSHASLVYVTNLLITDLIQISVKLIISVLRKIDLKMSQDSKLISVYLFIIMANVCFMICISAERYVMVAHPVWYRNIQTMRTSIFVSVTVWIILAVTMSLFILFSDNLMQFIISVLLLPCPLVMFFFVGTWRALSSNTSVPGHERRLIMGILALILCIYTVIFLPYVVILIAIRFLGLDLDIHLDMYFLLESVEVAIALNPLFDVLLYVLMRRDAKGIFRSLCFCVLKKHEESTIMDTNLSVFPTASNSHSP